MKPSLLRQSVLQNCQMNLDRESRVMTLIFFKKWVWRGLLSRVLAQAEMDDAAEDMSLYDAAEIPESPILAQAKKLHA